MSSGDRFRARLDCAPRPARWQRSSSRNRRNWLALSRYRILQPLFRVDPNRLGNSVWSDEPVAVLVPAKPDDAAMLPLVVDGIRRHVAHPLVAITIVAHPTDDLRALADRLGCVLVDERDVLPFTKQKIEYRPHGVDRSGWLFAQLIKLHADVVTGARFTLCCDADTVYVRARVCLTNDGRPILDVSGREYHHPYMAAYTRLTGLPVRSAVSFVTHQMLFDREMLERLRQHVHTLHGRPFWEAVVAATDRTHNAGFSEFETYGNFLLETLGQAGVCTTYSSNREVRRADADRMISRLHSHPSRRVKSVSCHSWIEDLLGAATS